MVDLAFLNFVYFSAKPSVGDVAANLTQEIIGTLTNSTQNVIHLVPML
jgi:hypothetical protein